PLTTSATARGKEIDLLRKTVEKAHAAATVLMTTPEDAEANLAVGKYCCFLKSEWDAGMPLLVLGSDPKLKQQAENDLAAPQDATAQAKVGDGWWDLAAKEPRAMAKHMRERASQWYSRALADLKGTQRSRVEDRLRVLLAEQPMNWDQFTFPF